MLFIVKDHTFDKIVNRQNNESSMYSFLNDLIPLKNLNPEMGEILGFFMDKISYFHRINLEIISTLDSEIEVDPTFIDFWNFFKALWILKFNFDLQFSCTLYNFEAC